MTRSAPAREASVIGAGPNGLSAAIVCAAAGLRVTVYEAAAEIGGGARTAPVTRPGFLHDLCSSVYPLGIASPFFRSLPLTRYGLEWLQPPVPLAHPLENGRAVIVDRSLDLTAEALGQDGETYRTIMRPFVESWQALTEDVLAPARWPRHPTLAARFALTAVQPAAALARRFHSPEARALLAGIAAHGGEPLEALLTSAFGLLLGALAHAVGWPVARGGARSIAHALAACLREQGGEIVTGRRIDTLAAWPDDALVLCDVAPEALAGLAGTRLPERFRRRLQRLRRTGGVFKVDWALDGPIPWLHPGCAQAGTVHLGGTFEEIAEAERGLARGRAAERPFVILTQPSVCDSTRAPQGQHAAWGYCHVPLASSLDMCDAIERQVERFAPGFRRRILARHVQSPADLARGNANLIGGDISGGAFGLDQFVTRPTWRGYATPDPRLFLCSSSTPPGPGVHGMCGYWAARTALRLR